MRYDYGTLFFSRTHSEDYRWYCKPDYVDDSLDTFFRPLFRMVERQDYTDFFVNEGRMNFYFLPGKTFCALCYLYITPFFDCTGRRIYALEGICCRKSESQIMWWNLPYLIYKMFGVGERGTLGISAFVQNWYSFTDYTKLPSDVEIPIRDFNEEKNDVLHEFTGKKNVFLNLIEEMYSSNKVYSFILGTREKGYYLIKTEKHYLIGEERKTYVLVSSVLADEVYSDNCRVRVYFSRGIKEYQMSVLGVSENDDLILEYKDIVRFDKEGVSYKRLNEIFRYVKRRLAMRGYQYGVIRRNQQCNKIEWFRKKYDMCNMEVDFLYGLMSGDDTYVESYITYEEQIIRHLFQYSMRIYDTYYSDLNGGGVETKYVLNLESGIWMFHFKKITNEGVKKVVLNGYCIRKTDVKIAWMKIVEFLYEWLYESGEYTYSKLFEAAFEKFCNDAYESVYPISGIISVLPVQCFPQIENLQVYSESAERNNLYMTLKKCEFDTDDYGNLRLIPPTILNRKWCLANFASEVNPIPIKCITKNYCELSKLIEEIQEC